MEYDSFSEFVRKKTFLSVWGEEIFSKASNVFEQTNNGDLPKWKEILQQFPLVKPSHIDLSTDRIIVGSEEDCSKEERIFLEKLLRQYPSWRKGPYQFFGIHIDAEWRSDMKWNRLKDQISSLKNRVVLDVGCGNGYHCWRMSGAGAKCVVGIDVTLLYVIQFHVMQKYIQSDSVAVLPLGIDDLPKKICGFDTVFSMGLLYHRRAPFDHLLRLKSFVREGGEVVLETLVIDGKKGDVLSPVGRYAQMPNVFFIPSVLTLEAWLERIGFKDVRLIDVAPTSLEEQRVTDWFGSQSLKDFLDPRDHRFTIEGYPAPQRAIFIANKIG